MAKDFSFDIVSETDFEEVKNAVNQGQKELATRFDFKGSESSIEAGDQEIILVSDDEQKLKSVRDVLESRLVKRKVSLKAVDYQPVEKATGNTVRQRAKIINGIETDKAKEIVKTIKNAKLKVQASIQGDQVRITGRKKDELQEAMDLIRNKDFGLPLKFTNYR